MEDNVLYNCGQAFAYCNDKSPLMIVQETHAHATNFNIHKGCLLHTIPTIASSKKGLKVHILSASKDMKLEQRDQEVISNFYYFCS
jgi:hypothetical protein